MGKGVVLWPERALVLSPFGRVAPHAHHASALLVGINGSFGFRMVGGSDDRWQHVSQLWVSAGCLHELDCGSTAVAVLFLAPGRRDHDAFCARHGISPLDPWDGLGGLHGLPMRAIWEGELVGAELDDWLRSLAGEVPPELCGEGRVDRAAQRIREQIDAGWTLDELARDARLSPSRLAHLFRARAGLTPHQLRLWYRMHTMSAEVARGRRLTDAAHAVGFVDSAHLSRSFRKIFGLPPSRVLTGDVSLTLRVDGPTWTATSGTRPGWS